MNSLTDPDKILEQKIITRCVLKGMPIKQIASRLNCSISTASYKTKQLFKHYKANDRHEFYVNVFTKLICEYKNKIEKLEQEIENLKNKETY